MARNKLVFLHRHGHLHVEEFESGDNYQQSLREAVARLPVIVKVAIEQAIAHLCLDDIEDLATWDYNENIDFVVTIINDR